MDEGFLWVPSKSVASCTKCSQTKSKWLRLSRLNQLQTSLAWCLLSFLVYFVLLNGWFVAHWPLSYFWPHIWFQVLFVSLQARLTVGCKLRFIIRRPYPPSIASDRSSPMHCLPLHQPSSSTEHKERCRWDCFWVWTMKSFCGRVKWSQATVGPKAVVANLEAKSMSWGSIWATISVYPPDLHDLTTLRTDQASTETSQATLSNRAVGKWIGSIVPTRSSSHMKHRSN